LIQLLAVLGFVTPLAFYAYLATLPCLLLLMMVDWRALAAGQDLKVDLMLSEVPEIDRSVVLHARVSGARGSLFHWSISLLGVRTLEVEGGSAGLKRLEESDGSLKADLPCRAVALGFETIRRVRLTVRSPLSWWFRQYELDTPELSFRVMPSRRDISEQAFRQLVHHSEVLSQGNRKIMRGRAAEQFHSVRKYQFPDEIRHIDQKKTAKYGQLMSRTYENFLSHHLILALDLGHSMFGTLGKSKKHDFYLAACLTLARNAVQSHDRVSFFGFSQQVHSLIRQARSLDAFLPLYQGSAEVAPRDVEGSFELLLPTLNRISGQRSIVLIFTDASRPSVQESLLRVLPGICQRHLAVVVGLLDQEYTLERQLEAWSGGPLKMEEYSRFLYNYWLADRFRVFRSHIARHSGGVVSVSEGDWLSVVARTYEMMRRSLQI
jgi:uncharacterized protein (DUF58 family)